MLLGMAVATNAMSYTQAREQALFLTDKMAYELNLTDDQYEAAYEINLDYLMSINSYTDLYGDYWRWRNLDLSYVLLDWQYRAYCDAAYFYRPLYYGAGSWHFSIYARYPRRDYFYFTRPTVYVSYRGGHSWRRNNGRSWYSGRSYGPRPGDRHFGMRDGFDRGDFGKGNRQQFGSRRNGALSTVTGSSFGSRPSSTRTTVTRPATGSSPADRSSSFGSRRSSTPSTSGGALSTVKPSTFSPTKREGTSFGSSRSSAPSGSSTFSTPRSSSSSSSSSFGSSRSSSSFGSSRSSAPSGSSTFSTPRSSSSSSSSSFGGSRSSAPSGSSRGSSFGSRR